MLALVHCQTPLFTKCLWFKSRPANVISILKETKVIHCQQYVKHISLEKFELLISSDYLLKTLHPNMTHCCEALKSMLSNYFCTTQVIKGTFWEIWHIQIQISPQTSIEPKYCAFYLKNLLIQLTSFPLIQTVNKME